MKKVPIFLLFLTAIFSANSIYAQKQIICNGKKITIDEKTTFVFPDSTSKKAWSFQLNGKAIYLPEPIYPAQAKGKNLKGAVAVQVLIDENGDVVSANALSGSEIFRKPAIEAAKKGKFKKLISNCQPRSYTGTVVFNFKEEVEKTKIIDVGDVTEKATYLPQPRVPFNIDFPNNEIVKVRVSINHLNGDVIEAKSISGNQKLRPFAEEAARCAKFLKSIDVQENAIGFINYKFDSSNKLSIGQMNGGILNSRAIFLPTPNVPPNIFASGSVTVRVNLDEEGNVISAKAVSGNICLGEAAVQATKKAQFKQTFLSGIAVKVSGLVVYNFPVKNN